MNQQQVPHKWIVSRGEYIALKLSAAGLSGLAWLCAICLGLLFLSIPYARYWDDQDFAAFVKSGGGSYANYDPLFTASAYVAVACFILPVPLLCIGFFLWKQARKSWKFLDEIQPVTHVETVHLPALQSLVRASQEPLQVQETILLRPAIETYAQHDEQLLRAAVGGQE